MGLLVRHLDSVGVSFMDAELSRSLAAFGKKLVLLTGGHHDGSPGSEMKI